MYSKIRHTSKRHHSSLLIAPDSNKNNKINRNHQYSIHQKQNQQPNLQTNRSFSKIERFRKQRIEKLYGKQQSPRSSLHKHQDQLKQKEMIILEYGNIIRRLETQNRNKDKMIMQLQKLQIQKQRQISTLTSNNISTNSTIQLLKVQIHHLNLNNQKVNNQLHAAKKQLQEKNNQLANAEQILAKKKVALQNFEELQPKLKQLEDLQDKLIAQNNNLKFKQQNILKALKDAAFKIKLNFREKQQCSTLLNIINNFLS